MLSVDDDGDAVGEPFCLVHVVRRQEDRLAEVAEVFDHVPGCSTCRGIEACGRLVEEDQFRVADQGEREVESAALAARETRGLSVVLPFESDERDRLDDGSRLAVVAGVQLERLRGPSGRGRARIPAGRSRCGRAIHASRQRDRRRVRIPRRLSGAGIPRGSRRWSSCRLRLGRGRRRSRRARPRDRFRVRRRSLRSSSATRAGVAPARWSVGSPRIAAPCSCWPSFLWLLGCVVSSSFEPRRGHEWRHRAVGCSWEGSRVDPDQPADQPARR